jgi:hypothetical protein
VQSSDKQVCPDAQLDELVQVFPSPVHPQNASGALPFAQA